MDHMKSPLEAPEKQIAEETSAKPEKRAAAAVIDTSKMSKGKREGLGLSQVNYGRAAMLLGSWDENLTALVSAHQSIGVPQPLLLFGTEEQKKKYLPRVARKEISAFALTEWNAGSDPANMSCRAEATEDGSAFTLNGEKLWCTNLIKAGVLVVMAVTRSEERRVGKEGRCRW